MMSIQASDEQHREAVRGKILDAARQTLIKKGYGKFTMRGVAEKAGCSPETLYLHFKSEEDILGAMVEEVFENLYRILEEISDPGDPEQSIKIKLRTYVEFGLRYPHHYQVAYIQRPPGRAVTFEAPPHRTFEVLRMSVRRCVDQGIFASSDVETTSQVLWTCIHGVTSLLIVLPKFPWVDRDRLIDQVIDTAIEGLKRPE